MASEQTRRSAAQVRGEEEVAPYMKKEDLQQKHVGPTEYEREQAVAQKGQEVTASEGREELPASHEDALKRGEEALSSSGDTSGAGGLLGPLKNLASRFLGHAVPETEGSFQTGLDAPINTLDLLVGDETSGDAGGKTSGDAGGKTSGDAGGKTSGDAGGKTSDEQVSTERSFQAEPGTLGASGTIGASTGEASRASETAEGAGGEESQLQKMGSEMDRTESAKEGARKATEEAGERAAAGWDAAKRGAEETSEAVKQAASGTSEDVRREASERAAHDAGRGRVAGEMAAAKEREADAERKAPESARAGAESAGQAHEEARRKGEEGPHGVLEIAQEALEALKGQPGPEMQAQDAQGARAQDAQTQEAQTQEAQAQLRGSQAQARESLDSVAERARQVMARTLEGIQASLEVGRERATHAGETVKQAGHEAYERGKEFGTETKDASVENLEAAGAATARGVGKAAGTVEGAAGAVGDSTRKGVEAASEGARGVYDRTAENISSSAAAARERAAQAGETSRQAGQEAYEKGKEVAAETKDASVENLEAAGAVTARGVGKAAGTVEGAAEAVGDSTRKGVDAASEGSEGAYDRTAENISSSATGALDFGAVATGTVAGAIGQMFHSFAETLGMAGKHDSAGDTPSAPSAASTPSAPSAYQQHPADVAAHTHVADLATHLPRQELDRGAPGEGEQERHGGVEAQGVQKGRMQPGLGGGVQYHPEPSSDFGGSGLSAAFASGSKADVPQNYPQKGESEGGGGGVDTGAASGTAGSGGGTGGSGAAAGGSAGAGSHGGDGTAATETVAGRSAVKSPSSDEKGVFGGGAVPGAKSVPWDTVKVGKGGEGEGRVDRRQQAESLKGGAREPLGRITKAVMDKSGIETTEHQNRIAGENPMAPKIADQREALGVEAGQSSGQPSGQPSGKPTPSDKPSAAQSAEHSGGKGMGEKVFDMAQMGDLVEQERVRRQDVHLPSLPQSVTSAAEYIRDAMVGKRDVTGGGDSESEKMADPALGRVAKEVKQKEQ